MSHPFLSDDWFAAYDRAREGVEVPDALKSVFVNLDVRMSDGSVVKARIENGFVLRGAAEKMDATVSAPRDIIYKALILGDMQTAMTAMATGRLHIAGDRGALMKMAMAPPTDSQISLRAQLKEITAA